MTTFNKKALLAELHDRFELIQNSVLPFSKLTDAQYNFKNSASEWSIAEIFEHLNITHKHYFKQIEKRLLTATQVSASDYKSSWMGDYFYNKIMPRPDGSVFKMKAPAHLHANSSNLDGPMVLQKFVNQLDDIQYLIEQAGQVDMQKIKIVLSFTKLLHLRLGDILRFLVAHTERHLVQANRMLQKLPIRELSMVNS